MEFHGKFHGIPWEISLNSVEFHGTEVDEIQEFTEFHGIRFRQGLNRQNREREHDLSKRFLSSLSITMPSFIAIYQCVLCL
jgi:hypothetical protein